MAKTKKKDRYAFFPVYCKSIINATLVPEHRFHPVRMWRFDFAIPELKIAIEVEGGFFSKGVSGHSSGKMAREDMEKYNTAALLGWRLLRLMPEQLDNQATFDVIASMILQVKHELNTGKQTAYNEMAQAVIYKKKSKQ